MTHTTAPRPSLAAPRALLHRLRAGDRRELGLWVALVVAAVVVRLLDLGDRAFHHDEGQVAYFSWQFTENPESYSYNPLLHGPLTYYLTALNFWLFGDSDFVARLGPAVAGSVLVALPYLLRRELGRAGAVAAGVALAFGPSFLYFSRFAGLDVYVSLFMLGIIIGCFAFVRRPRALTLSVVFGLASMAFAVKESGLVLCGLIALYFILAVVVQGVQQRRRGEFFFTGEVASACRRVGWMGWTYATATLLVVYGALFTVFFTDSTCTERNADGTAGAETSCIKSVVFGINYWREQHPVARGGDSMALYPSIMGGQELPIVLLALVGAYATLRRPNLFRLFVVFYFLGTLGFHMWAKERFAWLVLHPLLPLILLAAIGLQFLWERRSRSGRAVAAVAVAVGAAYLAWSSFDANARRGTDPRNMLVSTQTSQQTKQVVDQVLALDRRFRRDHAGTPLSITVDSSSGASFPYAWYLRDNPTGYVDLASENAQPPASQILILTDQARAGLLPNLSAYDGRRFDFRRWWIKREPSENEDGAYSSDPGDWLRYLVGRKAWTPTGGMFEWFYVRRDAGDLPRGPKSEIPPPPA